MKDSILKNRWNDVRKALNDTGVLSDLFDIENSLNVIKSLLSGITTDDEIILAGVTSLVHGLSVKVRDLAHGRTSSDTLPDE